MRYFLDMDTKKENGWSKRDDLVQVVESAPKNSEAYKSAILQLTDEPEIPHCLYHVWNWFWELHGGRSSGFNGPEPILYSEINAWVNTKKILIHDFEIDIIKKMDSIYLNFVNEHRQAKKPKNKGNKK